MNQREFKNKVLEISKKVGYIAPVLNPPLDGMAKEAWLKEIEKDLKEISKELLELSK